MLTTHHTIGLARACAAWTLIAVLISGCTDGETKVGKEDPGHRSQAIWGTYITDDGTGDLEISRAERNDRRHGVQGAVARISRIVNGEHEIFCSGTLVTPRHVVTAHHCLHSPSHGSGPKFVSFAQEPEQFYKEEYSERHSFFNSGAFVPGGDDLDMDSFLRHTSTIITPHRS